MDNDTKKPRYTQTLIAIMLLAGLIAGQFIEVRLRSDAVAMPYVKATQGNSLIVPNIDELEHN